MKKDQKEFMLRELEAADELIYNEYKILSYSYCTKDFKRLVGMPDGTYKSFNNYQEALEVLVNGGDTK